MRGCSIFIFVTAAQLQYSFMAFVNGSKIQGLAYGGASRLQFECSKRRFESTYVDDEVIFVVNLNVHHFCACLCNFESDCCSVQTGCFVSADRHSRCNSMRCPLWLQFRIRPCIIWRQSAFNKPKAALSRVSTAASLNPRQLVVVAPVLLVAAAINILRGLIAYIKKLMEQM